MSSSAFKSSSPTVSPRKRIKAKLRQWQAQVFGPPRRRQVRRFANPALGRLGLFQELHQRDIRYVVLRWFQDLPDWPAGEDVDLLVDNNDLTRLDDLFVHNDQSIPFDVYSTSAAKGADMKGLAYYPTNLAEQLLDNRVMHEGYCYVPSPEHYFLSLAFHAVYHKAEESGLPWDEDQDVRAQSSRNDHHYADLLRVAKPQCFGDVSLTVTGLHQFLASRGWSPAIDTLRKYSIFRPKLNDLVPRQESNEDGELLLFVFRKAAVEHDIVDESIEMLQRKHRLEVIDRLQLSESESLAAAAKIRGGNWGKGPYQTSGGPPAEIVAMFDYHPEPLSRSEQKRYPHVQNRRVLLKSRIRDRLNAKLTKQQKCNGVHTADDVVEAREYLTALGGTFGSTVIAKYDRIRDAYRTEEPVIRMMRRPAFRSKTELVRWNGQQAVKKTFRLSAKRFLDREIFAFENLSKVCQSVPKPLAYDDTSITLPYIPNVMEGLSLRRKNKLLRPYGREVFEVLKAIFDLGRFAIDFHPGNLLLTPEGRLFFVDFEFMQEYPVKPTSFRDCADLTCLPAGFDGDRPSNLPPNGYSYDDFWKPIFRSPLDDLLKKYGLWESPADDSVHRQASVHAVERAA